MSGLAIATDGSSLPVRFKAEYRVMDAEGNPTDEFKTLVDYSSSTSMKANVMARLSKSVFTDQVRVTFLNEGELGVSDIMLYKADVTSSLVSQISSVRDYLEGLTYGEFAGNYSESARDALLAVLDEADVAISGGLNSLEVAEWSAKVSDATSTFYHEGFVSLDRNSLYVGIDDAETLVSALEQQGLEKVAATLKDELAAAKQVAESYGDVTQADLDSAAEKLGAACDAALASLDATDRFEVTIAQVEELLDGAEIGDYDGQYPQAAADKLSAAIESARAAYEAAGGDATAVDAATSDLAAAKDEFMASVVRIDDSVLEQELARAEGLDESSYDKDAWAEFVAARDAAKAVDTSKISQADLDALVSSLAEKIDVLEKARLDRSDLLSLIATAQGKQEGDYTEDSWSAFAEAYERALEVRDAVSTTQAEVDEAAQNLLNAMDSLVGKNHGGTDEPEPEPASEQEMYRLYNRWTGEHFYTASSEERDVLVRVGWAFEGIGWYAPDEGDEVMRLYNTYVDGGDHHYTLDAHEYEALQGLGWRGEGRCWFSADPGSDGAVEIWRQYNPHAETGTHNYTPDRAENDALVGLGWVAEGIAWYGVTPADK